MPDVRNQHHANGHGIEGFEEFRRLQPPSVHRLSRNADALPGEDSFQPVQSQMVRAFADDRLGHEPRARQGAGNRLGRLLRHHDVLLRKRQTAFRQAFLAGIFLAHPAEGYVNVTSSRNAANAAGFS